MAPAAPPITIFSEVNMELTYDKVYKTLSVIDLTGKTEVKNGFTYLSGNHGVAIMNDHYPQWHVVWGTPKTFEDGSVEIYCKVSIDNLYKEMWYPVTNYANKPIIEYNGSKNKIRIS